MSRTTTVVRGATPGRTAPAWTTRSARAAAQRARRRHARFIGFTRLLVLMLVLALVVWAGTRVAHAADRSERLSGSIHLVRPGDTLWTIVVSEYGSTRYDVRELISLVEQLNGLHGQPLLPGERVRLPFID